MDQKAAILASTDFGLKVFEHYMPFPFTPKRHFRSPFYDDRRASCNIYFDERSGCYRMKDFGNEAYSGDCFWFVATLLGWEVKRDFPKVLATIISDMHLEYAITTHPTKSKSYPTSATSKPATPTTSSKDKPKPYSYTTKPFSKAELAYWGRYGISESLLWKYRVRSLQCFESISQTGQAYQVRSSELEPLYAYCGEEYVKLYRPMSKQRFMYAGEMPEPYCFGLEQLPSRGDVLFITGGEKDVLSLAAQGFWAIAFNSETSHIPEKLIEMLGRRFRHIILLYDTDETGRRASEKHQEALSAYGLLRITLPLAGTKEEKDISDFFRLGHQKSELTALVRQEIEQCYKQTLMLLPSCEINYKQPPLSSETIISVRGVPLGSCDNLFCITGGEGTGKSNYISAIIAGTLVRESTELDLLGLSVSPNTRGRAVLHYDTEQSEYQLYRNIEKSLRRAGLNEQPEFYRPIFLTAFSRKERLELIRDSLDLYYHRYGGIHLVVIDGVADLIRSANDESESIALVDELYRLAGMYKTCILCVLHFVPQGVKLRGHIGSELQRKSAAILSIERDDKPERSVVKALKVRDGSPLDVPLMLFAWDEALGMHAYRGEKSPSAREERKRRDLRGLVKSFFAETRELSYEDLYLNLMSQLQVKEQTARGYIDYMLREGLLLKLSDNRYTLCR